MDTKNIETSFNSERFLQTQKYKSVLTTLVFLVLFLFFLVVAFIKAVFPRTNMPTLIISKQDVATRGTIYSQDNYSLASSQKLFKLGFDTRFLNPDKKDFFIDFLSIYSNISKKSLKNALNTKGYTTLAYDLTPNTAANLKDLNKKFLAFGVFQNFKDKHNKVWQKQGLDIEVSGVSRHYPYQSSLEPIVGYVQKQEEEKLTLTTGKKGVEKSQNHLLKAQQNGIRTGKRDVSFNFIQNHSYTEHERLDGYEVYLSIPLKLQKEIETLLDAAKDKLKAKEILVGIINPKSGEILSLATSNRFNPNTIKTSDYENLNLSIAEKVFEPGSTIKPIVYSLLLEKSLINPKERINLNNGYYQLGKYTIKDDFIPSKKATIEDILIKSSNVGMIKITQNLSPKDFYNGLLGYGFAQKTGIDLSLEATGKIPPLNAFKREVLKGSISYGYGLNATFLQLLRAYAVFSNEGKLCTPYLVQRKTAPNGDIYIPSQKPAFQAISQKSARKMRKTLLKVVRYGTGKNAQFEGLYVGGKTGTARIAKNGSYSEESYNSSFFGFVEDERQVFTIGVVILGSHGKEEYYASKIAAPIFKEITEILVRYHYLSPSIAIQNALEKTKNTK
ncbi:peptidoglycan D,D-transpeptidase FtsI family protein [Helicobacter cetorum]|uniref:Cell division protein n=1 Tax=Helicobacter cetorum (strain ATCC BAA-540 / CCUG 52418 / MIT 99-5656) TaxID=1163745 RepID=I0ES55_HELCM|nr:penicillin-binding protein 2 [Helicobacter cetorum]AFI05774.1 cell division protein [Helicobacter cetorum MIT 99-5656]